MKTLDRIKAKIHAATAPETPTVDPEKFTEQIAQITDMLDVVRSACHGYRTKLEADGVSPSMAEAMVANLHTAWIGRLFAS